jgi:hypothetical protein
MQENLIDLTNRAREALTELFDGKLTRNLSTLNIDMDEEIHQEMKERLAALMIDGKGVKSTFDFYKYFGYPICT